ncbi:hypothetical protein ACFUAG_31010 [Streptomyces sp. NPDC057193]|uniref:hypothetical protein n=1 Tax=Streptomyces sp. NPDC057193 TaxID=3346043 RepID=UPI0036388CB3
MLWLTAGDLEHPGLLSYVKGLRFSQIEAFDTSTALTAPGLLHAGHSWAAVYAIHAARSSAAFPAGRLLLTLTPASTTGPVSKAVH